VKPALTACSIPFSCPPWSSVCDVFLSPQVVHKAVLDVAETGTEAAAATGVKVNLRCGKIYSMTIYFNRPFLMIISDINTHIAVFMAKVTNPK
jgi:serpin peptidase inhibitor clade A protein 3